MNQLIIAKLKVMIFAATTDIVKTKPPKPFASVPPVTSETIVNITTCVHRPLETAHVLKDHAKSAPIFRLTRALVILVFTVQIATILSTHTFAVILPQVCQDLPLALQQILRIVLLIPRVQVEIVIARQPGMAMFVILVLLDFTAPIAIILLKHTVRSKKKLVRLRNLVIFEVF